MLTGTKQSLHLSAPQGAHPSLLLLRKALNTAENGTPPRPPFIDANEQLAMQLIARMQADYKKAIPFLNGQEAASSYDACTHLQEVAGIHAR
jgi:hypothetical protein